MASRNTRNLYIDHTHYHVFNRGVNKRKIFLDNEDYAVFLNLFKRYLSRRPTFDNKKREYPWLYNDIELLAFCLMPNHFHLLLYPLDEKAISSLLKNICGSYTKYFNKKYERVGPLFQDRLRAKPILDDGYLQHISRYIHMNPTSYLKWEHSSLPYFTGKNEAEWIHPERILEIFNSKQEYLKFLKDYEGQKEIMNEIKGMLADS